MTRKTFSCNAKFVNLPHPEFKVIISWLNMLYLIINQSYSFKRFLNFFLTLSLLHHGLDIRGNPNWRRQRRIRKVARSCILGLVVILSKLNNSHVWNWNCQSTTKVRIIVHNSRYSRRCSAKLETETLFAVFVCYELLSFIQLLDKTAPILNYISTFFVTLDSGCWIVFLSSW